MAGSKASEHRYGCNVTVIMTVIDWMLKITWLVKKASEHRYGCDATVIMIVIDWMVITFL